MKPIVSYAIVCETIEVDMAHFKQNRYLLLLIVLFLATGCGGGGGDGSVPASIEPLSVTVTFPGSAALTSENEITLRGKTSGAKPAVAVRVNGVAATTDDGFSTWQSTVALDTGVNLFSIEAQDAEGTIAKVATDLSIERSEFIHINTVDSVYDPVRQRVLFMLENSHHAYEWDDFSLVAFDLGTSPPNSMADFRFWLTQKYPRAMVLDAPGNRMLVADGFVTFDPVFSDYVQKGQGAVMAYDLSTGTPTLISDTSRGIGPEIGGPRDMVLDADNRRLLVTNEDIDGQGVTLLAIDLDSGNRTAIASGLNLSYDMGLDETNNRVIMTAYQGAGRYALQSVDVMTGSITTLSDDFVGTGPAFVKAVALELDPNGNTAYIIDAGLRAVLAVDLNNGNRTIMSGNDIGQGPVFSEPWNIHASSATGHVNVTEGISVWDVELGSGNRTIAHPFSPCVGSGPRLGSFSEMALDKNGRFILIAGENHEELLAVDLKTGDRDIVSSATKGSGPGFDIIFDIELADDGQHAYVIDSGTNELYSVDLTNGDRIPIGDGSPDPNDPFPELRSLSLDGDKSRILLSAAATDHQSSAVVAVDLNTGARHVVSSKSVGTGPSLGSGGDIIGDFSRNRVVWAGADLLAIKLDSGDRTLIAGLEQLYLESFGVDTDRVVYLMRQITGDALPDNPLHLYTGINSITMQDGTVSTISDDTKGSGPRLRYPGSLILDVDNNRAFVCESNQLMVVDLMSGDRAIVSKKE